MSDHYPLGTLLTVNDNQVIVSSRHPGGRNADYDTFILPNEFVIVGNYFESRGNKYVEIIHKGRMFYDNVIDIPVCYKLFDGE